MRRFVLIPDVKMQFLCQSHPSASWTRASGVPLTGMVFYDVAGEVQKYHGKNRTCAMSQTECATSSSNPARLCRSGTTWRGRMDRVMQGLWKSPSLRRRTWTTVEKKGRQGAEPNFRARQNPNIQKYLNMGNNIKIQVPDMKPASRPG